MMEDSRRILSEIKDAPWLLEPHVHMKSPEKVVEKINSIVQGGGNKLQLIFDFDRTLVKHHENGVNTISSYGLLESLPTLPQVFKEKAKCIMDKYHPIEIDPYMTLEEKIPYMVEWWNSGLEVLKTIPWDSEVVSKHIRENLQPLRDGTVQCLQQLHREGVPVLVFSAGIGDVVQLVLSYKGVTTPNLHIISNFLKINEGKVLGYIGEIIHVFNKDEHLVENTPYNEELKGRTNVILLGDSLGDAKMADGVPHDTVLKIGFLNDKIEEHLPNYLESFDIVLADDQTMDVLSHILKAAL